MKKNILKRFTALFLAAALMTPAVSVASPATVQAAASTTYTIKLTKVTDAVAKKVFNALMKGKKVVFTFNGEPNLYLFGELSDQISTKYAYDVDFHATFTDKTIFITEKQAKKFAKQVKKERALINKANATAVSSASDALAQEIHNTLMTQTPYTFYTKVKPTAICNDLIRKVQEINKQDVIFKYDVEKVSGTDCYQVTIDNEHAGAYYWAVSLCQKEFPNIKNSIQEYLYAKVDEADEPEVYDYDYYYNGLSNAERIILGTENFGDLSDIMKLYFISYTGIFDSFLSKGISYTSDRMSTKNEAEVLEALYRSTAHGMCDEFARCEVILFSYWGIDVKYCDSRAMNHAWTEGKAANSKGEMIRYMFDYMLETIDKYGSFSEAGGDRDCLN